MSKKEAVIFSLTNEFHDDITNIYESLIDNETTVGFKIIDELRQKLKALKDNLTKKDEL